MLVVRIVGGLGNQLFLYAVYRYLVTKGKKVKLDTGFYDKQDLTFVDEREYVLEKYFNIKADYVGIFDKAVIKFLRKAGSYPYIRYKDKGKGYENEIDDLRWKVIEGVWDTFYFADIIRQDLMESLAPGTKFADDPMIKEIRRSQSVSIHVRRGDYLRVGYILPAAYYEAAIGYIRSHVENARFYCFSDDIEYCREIFSDEKICFVEGRGDLYDFTAMSQCRHNIVANSTFSTWSAWCNNNSDKIVIHPEKWHGDQRTEVDDRIWPEEWVCL